MDKHIKLLYDRLEGDKDRQNRFTTIINGAVKEMEDNGVFSPESADVPKEVFSDDPRRNDSAPGRPKPKICL